MTMFFSLRHAWGRVRWKMVAIIVSTGSATLLTAYLAIAALNVVVRGESANIVEKQIQVLVQASSSVTPAILDHAGVCDTGEAHTVGLKALLTYTNEAFPEAQISLLKEDNWGVDS